MGIEPEVVPFCRTIAGEGLAASQYVISNEVPDRPPGGRDRHLGRDGPKIVPVGELRSVRPWRDYEESLSESRPQSRIDVAPHLSFMALGRRCESESSLTDDVVGSWACDWCSKHGLLGILLHEQTEFRFPGENRSYFRSGLGWGVCLRPEINEYEARSTRRPWELSVDWYPCHFPQGHLSGFWQNYSEPLTGFLDYAKKLGSLFSTLQAPGSNEDSVDRSMDKLNDLAWTGTEQLVRNTATGRLESRWVAGTLLSALARMCIFDLTSSANLKNCEFGGCYNMFRARTNLQKYCSDQCQNSATKRRQRARKGGRDE